MNKILKAALEYEKMGYSVIPVKKNKKPFVKWERYQTERADPDQIQKWWEKWPSANIGLVTGEISGIDVVDCDSEQGQDAVNEFLSDSFITPMSKTPRGWHFFFKHKKGLSNGVRVLKDTDLRTSGGYVVVPPSKNGDGESYTWMQDLSISDVLPAPMPDMLFEILQSDAMRPGFSLNKQHSFIESQQKSTNPEKKNKVNKVNKSQQSQHFFKKGLRDESLFHLANCLVKGGMSGENIRNYLLFFASNCKPPFPEKEAIAKIESALKRQECHEENLTATIREVIRSTKGSITSTYIQQRSTKSTLPKDKRKISTILGRMVKEGLLERTSTAGVYRIIESACDPEDWQNACTDTVKLWLPFELNEMISIMPGSLLLIAGAQDAGKSALQMNIAKENMHDWTTHYYSSELNAAAFKNRMSKFPDVTPDMCPIKFYSHSTNFHDVIKTGKNDLNIIDYLEIHDNFYKVSEYLSQIHKKLGDAICIVALQKDPQALYGRGGSFTQEKPILSVALDYGKATISKFKGEFRGENPRGKEYHFKLLDGCRIVKGSGWHKPPPKIKK